MITAIGLQRRSTDLTSRRSSTSSDDARQIHRLTVKTSPQQRRRTGSAINLSSCHAPLDLIARAKPHRDSSHPPLASYNPHS
jgi:hypothetical protein